MLQSAIRALTRLAPGQYWFPDVRSLPGAGLFLGLALYPYVYMLARIAFADRSPSLAEAARSMGLRARSAWWRVIWPVARPAVAAGTSGVVVIVCGPVFDEVVGAACGGDAEDAWLAGTGRPDLGLVDRFEAGPRRVIVRAATMLA